MTDQIGEEVDPKAPAVRADAVDRFTAEIKAAQAAAYRAAAILRESQGRSYNVYPKFAWGERLKVSLDQAQAALYEAHREAAIQGYDEHLTLGHVGSRDGGSDE